MPGLDRLALPPHLRLWKSQGLNYVLADQPIASAARPDTRREPSPPPQRQAKPRPEPKSEPRRQAPPPLPDAGWPPPWDGYAARVKPGCKVLWTYFDLAADYAQPDGQRRKLWAGLLAELDWRGGVGFWPLSEVRQGELLGRADLFWRGVRQFGVPLLVAFGCRAHQVIFPGKEYGFRRCDCNGVSVLTLPGPNELLTEPQALALARRALGKVK